MHGKSWALYCLAPSTKLGRCTPQDKGSASSGPIPISDLTGTESPRSNHLRT
jgi:hypothetical protein